MEIKGNYLYQTGYFANSAKSTTKRTKVHIVADGKPICGAAIDKESSFLFCSNGVNEHYLECTKCKKYL